MLDVLLTSCAIMCCEANGLLNLSTLSAVTTPTSRMCELVRAYTLSHCENDRDVSAYSRGRCLITRVACV